MDSKATGFLIAFFVTIAASITHPKQQGHTNLSGKVHNNYSNIYIFTCIIDINVCAILSAFQMWYDNPMDLLAPLCSNAILRSSFVFLLTRNEIGLALEISAIKLPLHQNRIQTTDGPDNLP